ncbi:MAG: sulfatase-like hydrolase/transferase [Candidatus Solibacter usitatus]|nr:sulfatase-like hydrolase/transferase [Candidatus Solibacter usitatus]
MTNRRQFLTTSAAALAAPAGHPPNVLVLFADDLRFNTIHALGNPEVRTPALDRLAASGVSFDRAHIMGGDSGAVCIASRAMLLTGQTLFHSMANVHGPKERESRFTFIGEHFRNSGYQTFGAGKWHNPPRLFNRCFEGGGSIFFGGMTDQFKIPVQDYDPAGAYGRERRKIAAKASSELFADEAIGFLKNRDGKRPFFLYTAFTSPHDPRTAPNPYREMYSADRIQLPGNFMGQHPFDNGELKVRDELLAGFPRSPNEVCRHIADYYAMITHLDTQVGRILDALKESGQDKHTIVVFAGDNGLALGQHGLMGKQNLYDHSVRVPLILAGPGIPKGQRRQSLAYLLDLFPTLCDLTSTKTPATVDGVSLQPAIRSPKAAARDDLFLSYRHFQRGLSNGEWKLILYNVGGTVTTQLFQIKEDPLETENLAQIPEAKPQADKMTARLKEWMKKVDDPLDLDKPAWGYTPPRA